MSETSHARGQSTYEQRDVSFPPIVLTSFILLAVVLLSFVTMWWLLNSLTVREVERQGPISAVRLEQRRELPPEPRLQAQPLRDMQELRAAEDALLEKYGWIDESAGVVRIPLDRALELTAERGLPSQGAKN